MPKYLPVTKKGKQEEAAQISDEGEDVPEIRVFRKRCVDSRDIKKDFLVERATRKML